MLQGDVFLPFFHTDHPLFVLSDPGGCKSWNTNSKQTLNQHKRKQDSGNQSRFIYVKENDRCST